VNVLVVGAGAVGSWLGGALAAGGTGVTLVDPGPRREAIARDGLTLIDGRRVTRVRPPLVATVPEALAAARFDVALVAVKSYHTADVAAALAAAGTHAPPRVASFQNGVGNDDILAAALPAGAVLAATLTTGLVLEADGAVRGSGRGGAGLGRSAGGPPSADLAAALARGGLSVSLYALPAAMKWSKLLLNLLGSATSAILGWPTGRVFADRRLFQLERAAWLEALAVMRALGLSPVALPGYPVPLYARAAAWLPPGPAHLAFGSRLGSARADRLPSVAADLAAGRRQTENAVLTRAVAEHGLATGTPVPLSRAMSDLVDDLAAGRVSRERFANRPEALLAHVAPGT